MLLVVLSLLALFVLVGTTYVATSGVYWRTTAATTQIEREDDAPPQLLEEALLQVLRDTDVPHSAVRYHSLLNDAYGSYDDTPGIPVTISDPVIHGTITSVSQATSDLVRLDFSSSVALSDLDDFYNGRVITFTSGDQNGISSRIVRYDQSSSPTVYTVYIDNPANDFIDDSGNPKLKIDDKFIINSRAFNGSGFGLRADVFPGTTSRFSLSDRVTVSLKDRDGLSVPQDLDTQLLPGLSQIEMQSLVTNPAFGGMDESWDAADLQNLFLSGQGSSGFLPSFHRPALAREHQANYAAIDNFGNHINQDFWRSVIFRPTKLDHPLMSHVSAPGVSDPGLVNTFGFDPISGPWDVDNDGDGTADSIWLDLGFPAKTSANGKRYKPLFAILIKDMDGRVNINAAGNLSQLDNAWFDTQTGQPQPVGGVDLPRGLGYGPHEINFTNIVGESFYSEIIGQRYGEDGQPGDAGVDTNDDQVTAYRDARIADSYPYDLPEWESFEHSGPTDVHGRNAIALDARGQPTYAINMLQGESIDDPLEMNLTSLTGTDAPLDALDLEAILRFRDADQELNLTRLTSLIDTNGVSFKEHFINDETQHANLAQLTTLSFEVPATPAVRVSHSVVVNPDPVNPEIRVQDAFHPSLLELFDARLRAVRFSSGLAVGRADRNKQLKLMLPMEAYYGLPLDLNRQFSSNNRQAADRAKRDLAKRLYCTMMFLQDEGTELLFEPGVPAMDHPRLTARRVAQWAVNVVDFRDPDSAMTYFEYDENPFDGWDFDGVIGPRPGDDNQYGTADDIPADDGEPDRGLVWGAEQPELLITETIAFHDRRVKDEDVGNRRAEDLVNPIGEPDDEDLDQHRIPQGSLFVELYSPGPAVTNNPTPPQDLYNINGELDLSRTVDEAALEREIRHPVWRIVVANEDTQDPFKPANTERVVWFKPWDLLDDSESPEIAGSDIFYNRGADIALQPDQHLVIAPRFHTYLGEADGTAGSPLSRQAISVESNNSQIRVSNFTGDDFLTQESAQVMIAAAVTPDRDDWKAYLNTVEVEDNPITEIGINVSEPRPRSMYYAAPDLRDASFPNEAQADSYASARDIPFDSRVGMPLHDNGSLTTGTYLEYQFVFLQRLADPALNWNPEPGNVNHDIELPANPYITVDKMAVDLTVFNGSDRKPTPWPFAADVPFDPDGEPVSDVYLQTRQRGVSGEESSVWSSASTVGETPDSEIVESEYFRYLVAPPGSGIERVSFGDLNDTLVTPFPWMTWNNRPYVSRFEVMLVPSGSAAEILEEFRVSEPFGVSAVNPYGTTPGPDSVDTDLENYEAPFRHLLNFFYDPDALETEPKFYRILDFIDAPSRSLGTERWYSASLAGLIDSDYQRDGFAAQTFDIGLAAPDPLSSVSAFRVPGKINLNTIYDEAIWQSVVRQFSPHDTIFDEIETSREGSGLALNYGQGNPFRDGASAFLNVNGPFDIHVGNQTTLLRGDTTGDPMFMVTESDAGYLGMGNLPYENPFFAYQGLQRLANLTTTRSSVFAVWITVGYFEVEPWLVNPNNPGIYDPTNGVPTIDNGHRDGLTLGSELGSDNGAINRHRAFYIIDRSIPVGFEPGKDHNVEDTVILRRSIE